MLQTLLTLLSGKLGATAAAAVVAAGTVGAGATDRLPDELQNAFDAVAGADDEEELEELEAGSSDADLDADGGEEDLGLTTDDGEDAGDERSDTAKAVHEALTGDADLQPGDEGFGEAVADNARDGGVGGDVSDAASGGKARSGDDAGDEAVDGEAVAEEAVVSAGDEGDEGDDAADEQDDASTEGRERANEARGDAGH